VQASKRVFRIVAWIANTIIGLVIVAYIGANVLIAWGVRSDSSKAVAKFSGDRIEALIATVNRETCSLHDRNRSVWALGQLRDKRALPVLYKYYTGKRCDHKTQICQNELRKAIKWTEGNSFMLPQLWRPFL